MKSDFSSPQGNFAPVNRRNFLKLSGIAAAASFVDWSAIAGPFDDADFEQMIPADKKLRPEWVKSLFERGEPSVYRGRALETIGMPIGGIGCGQVYLGGDGRMWHWDIFNQPYPQAVDSTMYSGPNYKTPPKPISPIEQGFAIKVTAGGKSQVRRLDDKGFNAGDIAFRGQYPMAFIDYKDGGFPVTVSLEAFSPFIPLNVADSSLPMTVMGYSVKNTSSEPVAVEIGGWLENAVCFASGKSGRGRRCNAVLREAGMTIVQGTAEPLPEKDRPPTRSEIVFEDFENGYGKWSVEGEAFGKEPASGTLPNQQDVSGFLGKRLVNTFLNGDSSTGKLTSKPFKIARRHIAFLIGGGSRKNETCINLLLEGKAVRSVTGRDQERLTWSSWDVAEFEGKEARLEIVDKATGGWGHINIDQIVFTDTPPGMRSLEGEEDFGSMSITVLGESKDHFGSASLQGDFAAAMFDHPTHAESVSQPFGAKLVGGAGRRFTLGPGQSAQTTFLITWYIPSIQRGAIGNLIDLNKLRREYANRFDCAAAVARYGAQNIERLAGETRLWNRTWYDSTLPYWFLDRLFAPICTLATSTCYIFNTGRFYAFEGVYCCHGTCQHVWNYAHSVARIFPALERDLRQRTDFGTAWHEDGAIDYRGECDRRVAHDGQCGVILRAWREHQMSADGSFLKQCWPRIKKSVEYMIGCDGDENGLLEGEQYNTLDASWFGAMAWISSFYIAALRAGEAMAREAGDNAFAERCRNIAERGSSELLKQLYNGEYFIHKPDPKHPDSTNTNNGCHIDQLMGQAWVMQVGLPRVIPTKESLSALEAIWKYNFTPDIGPYRDKSFIKGGRWYAMPGEGGVIMTTFPRGGIETASGKGGFAYYLNEVWTGQEHQVAAHMFAEGMVEKGMVITRVLHDRHHPTRRNPYNEIECSDHYTRAMASHGSFVAVCGFEHHGPMGHIGFAPKFSPEKFRAPFTSAEGWGTFAQQASPGEQRETLEVKWGKLRVKTLAFETASGAAPTSVTMKVAGQDVRATLKADGRKLHVTLAEEKIVNAGQSLEILFA